MARELNVPPFPNAPLPIVSDCFGCNCVRKRREVFVQLLDSLPHLDIERLKVGVPFGTSKECEYVKQGNMHVVLRKDVYRWSMRFLAFLLCQYARRRSWADR